MTLGHDMSATLDWTRSFRQLDNGDGIASLGDLGDHVIVVHGVDLNGDGVANKPRCPR